MNTVIVKRWIDYAKTDFKSAKILFNSRSKYADKSRFRLVIWLCHQCIEKILKANISKRGKKVMLIHDLMRLYDTVGIALNDEQIVLLKELNTYYIPPRYPDLRYSKSLPPFTKERAIYFLQHTEKLFLCLKKYIQKKS